MTKLHLCLNSLGKVGGGAAIMFWIFHESGISSTPTNTSHGLYTKQYLHPGLVLLLNASM